MRNLSRAGLAGLAGLVLLAGCSVFPVGPSAPPVTASSPSPAAQSQTEACLALAAALGADLGGLPSVLSELNSDPAKALKVLKAFAANLAKASATLTNPKVRAQAGRLATALDALIVEVQKVIRKPTTTSKLGKAADKVRAESSALGSLCTGL
jgi:hypothetical protein